MLLKEKTKINKEIDIFKNIPSLKDIIVPDTITEHTDYIYSGYNKYSRNFVMTIYPEQTWIRLVR